MYVDLTPTFCGGKVVVSNRPPAQVKHKHQNNEKEYCNIEAIKEAVAPTKK